ncbi:hypothetical protein [Pseudomonas aeruginosa]|uniref:hypothetical protein n=1 Tax=Pseudomonas aeruginosa TaxID=287 RepID=UPI0034D209B9
MFKYLYGKKQFLAGLIEGSTGIRLSDLAYYSIMENDLMRDNELEKPFVLDRDGVSIEINGMKINPLDMASNPVFTVMTPRCFCVCFSGKKNDQELFERFNADVCIEVNVPQLIKVLEALSERFEGMTVVSGEVYYYPEIMRSPFPGFEESLFYKRDVYAVEDEYRVALTIPRHRTHFKSVEGDKVSIFSDDPNDVRHMFVNGKKPEVNMSYINSVTYR